MITSKENAEHYIWGNNCDSWVLLNSENLSVKQEMMPPKTKEQLHFHRNAQQFFFILKGKAKFHKDENIFEVSENSGFHILQNFTKTKIFLKYLKILVFTFCQIKFI